MMELRGGIKGLTVKRINTDVLKAKAPASLTDRKSSPSKPVPVPPTRKLERQADSMPIVSEIIEDMVYKIVAVSEI